MIYYDSVAPDDRLTGCLIKLVQEKIEKKFDFELEKIEVTKDPVGVKLLTKRINDAAGKEKILPVQITKYLLEKGYLRIVFDEKTKTENRMPTDKGIGLGIENFWEINKYYREYSKNYYGEAAQRFIIEHLNDIILITANEAYKNR